MVRKFLVHGQSGNIAIVFALIAPVLLGFVGAGVDYARFAVAQEKLQSIADKAALAGARQFTLTRADKSLPETLAKQVADNALSQTQYAAGAKSDAQSDEQEYAVTTTIDYQFKPTLLVSMFKSPIAMSVTASAQALGSANICVITLSENKQRSLDLSGSSRITGNSCAIYANSTHNQALSVTTNAKLTSSLNCSSGGYDGAAMNFDPIPVTDCPKKDDPLASRAVPTPQPCTTQKETYHHENTTIMPGTFCNGLVISGTSDVTMAPGVYYFPDAELVVRDTATLTGDGVGFYFSGTKGRLVFNPDTSISLSAPTTGDMAGLLVAQDPAADPQQKYVISSNNAHTLIGTIYLPKGDLYIDAQQPVAAASAYTAIIVDELELTSSVNLVLNSDYADTDVPVPAGIEGGAASIYLRN